MSKVQTCLWFNGNGAAAAEFYVGLIPGSSIDTTYAVGTEPLMVAFALAGVPYVALNGGNHCTLTPAASIRS